MNRASKKTKPSAQKGAFASIFKKANEHEMSKKSPGRQKSSATTKVTPKTGNFISAVCWLL